MTPIRELREFAGGRKGLETRRAFAINGIDLEDENTSDRDKVGNPDTGNIP